MLASLRLLLLACLPWTVSCDASAVEAPPSAPAVILMIGDGMGAGAVDAGRLAFGPLAMESLPVRAEVRTASASDEITDSGAAATAYATGVSTYNGAIGVDPDTVPLVTILEAAEARGMATGLVSTSEVTHATPAAFAAHVASRTMEYEIARQLASSGVDVLLGGGVRYFDGSARPDGADMIAPFAERGCAVQLETPVPATPPAGTDCLLGLLAPDALPPAADRTASLATMARVALATLNRDPDGFFLMIEGSQIDWAAHDNLGGRLLRELADFDAAVAEVVTWAADRPGTVVVVTADHETGGLTATAGPEAGDVSFAWTTKGHTAADVPLFALGLPPAVLPLPDRVPNREVGRLLRELLAP